MHFVPFSQPSQQRKGNAVRKIMRKVRVEPCACVCTVRVRRLRTGEQSTRGGRVRRRGLRGALSPGRVIGRRCMQSPAVPGSSERAFLSIFLELSCLQAPPTHIWAEADGVTDAGPARPSTGPSPGRTWVVPAFPTLPSVGVWLPPATACRAPAARPSRLLLAHSPRRLPPADPPVCPVRHLA